MEIICDAPPLLPLCLSYPDCSEHCVGVSVTLSSTLHLRRYDQPSL